jgi:hypothetical protein
MRSSDGNKKIVSLEGAVREALYERMPNAAETIGRAVRPIYGVEKGKPSPVGSCIFLKRASGHFLLTAAHVLDEHKGSVKLEFSVQGEFVPLDGLSAMATKMPDKGRDADAFDFSVARLPTTFVEKFSALRYVEAHEISSDIDTHGRAYMALGFPCSRNKKKIRHDTKIVEGTEALTYGATVLRDEALAKKMGISGNEHYFIAYEKRSRDMSGAVVNSVAPIGMSGGALIDLGRMSASSLEPSTVYSFKLAGLLIERHHKERRIVAVKLGTILAATRI